MSASDIDRSKLDMNSVHPNLAKGGKGGYKSKSSIHPNLAQESLRNRTAKFATPIIIDYTPSPVNSPKLDKRNPLTKTGNSCSLCTCGSILKFIAFLLVVGALATIFHPVAAFVATLFLAAKLTHGLLIARTALPILATILYVLSKNEAPQSHPKVKKEEVYAASPIVAAAHNHPSTPEAPASQPEPTASEAPQPEPAAAPIVEDNEDVTLAGLVAIELNKDDRTHIPSAQDL